MDVCMAVGWYIQIICSGLSSNGIIGQPPLQSNSNSTPTLQNSNTLLANASI